MVIFPLGDAAATIELGAGIDEAVNNKVLAMQEWFRVNAFDGLKDVIVAYSSLTLIYDPVLIRKKFKPVSTVFELVQYILEEAYHDAAELSATAQPIIRIPVCYDNTFGIDLNAVATKQQLTTEEIIHLHTTPVYRVYMIGFLPGFPYLATIDKQLQLPRKVNPVQVPPGSVGIAGAQTGVYPFYSPGGWHIIGRTPVKLFNPDEPDLTTLKAGDNVQFYAISKADFEGFNDLI